MYRPRLSEYWNLGFDARLVKVIKKNTCHQKEKKKSPAHYFSFFLSFFLRCGTFSAIYCKEWIILNLAWNVRMFLTNPSTHEIKVWRVSSFKFHHCVFTVWYNLVATVNGMTLCAHKPFSHFIVLPHKKISFISDHDTKWRAGLTQTYRKYSVKFANISAVWLHCIMRWSETMNLYP